MKRIVSILLCAVLLLSLAACGASAPADADDNAPASALELLETVWNSYSDDEKFPAAGGDYSEENMRDGAPGNFSMDDADLLDSSLGFPAAEAGKIDGAAYSCAHDESQHVHLRRVPCKGQRRCGRAVRLAS